jgi:uncharacterized MAPEG superfamily protein
MFIAVLCVLLSMLQPFVLSVLARSSTRRGDYLPSPREYNEGLTGWHRRAHFAQLNAFEAFPPFAAAVVLSWLAGVPHERINLLAVLFVVFRIGHAVFYVKDKPTLRSQSWKLAMMAVVALYVLTLIRLA